MTNLSSRMRMVFGQVFMPLMIFGLLVLLVAGGVSANEAPLAVDDEATTTKSNAVTINGAVNDSDSDGTLNLASVTPETTTTGAGAAVQYNHDGTFTYAPVTDYTGEDSFVYQICDN